MMRASSFPWVATAALTVSALGVLAGSEALAHVNPAVKLMSDRDAMAAVLPLAREFSWTDVKPTAAQRETIRKQWGWTMHERSFRVYSGRDAQGRPAGSVVFVTEPTLHGPVRVAAGLDMAGKLVGAAVVEVSEETYPWVKPLIVDDFTRAFLGRDARGDFAVAGLPGAGRQRRMQEFYARLIAGLLKRAAVLYEVSVRAEPPKA